MGEETVDVNKLKTLFTYVKELSEADKKLSKLLNSSVDLTGIAGFSSGTWEFSVALDEPRNVVTPREVIGKVERVTLRKRENKLHLCVRYPWGDRYAESSWSLTLFDGELAYVFAKNPWLLDVTISLLERAKATIEKDAEAVDRILNAMKMLVGLLKA